MRLFMISGPCGSGKSTMKDALTEIMDPARYACIDIDEVGFNWWDYAGTDHESKYHDDCIAEAVKRAAGRDLIFVSCTNPQDFIEKHVLPEGVDLTVFIILNPTDEAIWERLRARPAERGFTSDDKIEPHIGYNQWFRRNKGKFPLVIDNTNQTIDETAGIIRKFIESYPKM
ncbi:MAG: AAA family ATPase [Lachnospiraceae bacterium]|nr:AAA family ATPase [Lachnospiraceae bacterium]